MDVKLESLFQNLNSTTGLNGGMGCLSEVLKGEGQTSGELCFEKGCLLDTLEITSRRFEKARPLLLGLIHASMESDTHSHHDVNRATGL